MINSSQYICDTNVLISSLISRNSPPAQTIDYIKNTGLLAFSSETFSELEEVLNRPKFKNTKIFKCYLSNF